MAKIKAREVKCEDCGYVFKSSMKFPRCGSCGKTNCRPLVEEPTEASEKIKTERIRENPKLPLLPFMTGFDLETQNNIQFLMNLGLGKTPETLIKKAIQNMRLNHDGKGGKMLEATDTLEKIQNSRLIDAEIKRIENESNNGKSDNNDDLEREFKLAQLKKLQSQAISPLETMMTYELFKKNNGGTNNGSELESLRNEIKELKEQQKYEELRKSNEELKALVLETAKNKTGDTQTALITQMSTIFAKRDTDIERLRAEVETAKRDAANQMLSEKISRLEQALGGQKSELATFKDTFGVVKELSKEFGGTPVKKSGMEAAQELITGVVGQIQKPILEPIGQAMAQSIANQNTAAQTQIPTQPIQQPITQEIPASFTNSESEISKGLVNISSQ